MENQNIIQKLKELEEEYDVEVIIARDFGSKAWNLDSESSDYDVGFIFRQPQEQYLGISGFKENISRHFEFEEQEHTFQGWNYKRFFQMLSESNPTTIEFLNSPITYYAKEGIGKEFEELKEYANDNFKPIGIFYNYRSLAKNNYRKYVQDRLVNNKLKDSFKVVKERDDHFIIDVQGNEDIYGGRRNLEVSKQQVQGDGGRWHRATRDTTVKRNIYAVRGLTYARYVQQTHRFPSLNYPDFVEKELEELAEKEVIPQKVVDQIQEWIEMKRNEQGDKDVGNPLEEWIEAELNFKLDNPEHNVKGIEEEKLNQFILENII